MKNEMTVKELKDILAKYDDNDWVTIKAFPFWDGAEAALYVDGDEVMDCE